MENSKENFVMQYINRLNNLNLILQNSNVVPIFITQIEYDGLRNSKLFLINKETKKFAKKNNYLFIPLDEIAIMEEGDFYDPIHTTPQGSKKIAKLLLKPGDLALTSPGESHALVGVQNCKCLVLEDRTRRLALIFFDKICESGKPSSEQKIRGCLVG